MSINQQKGIEMKSDKNHEESGLEDIIGKRFGDDFFKTPVGYFDELPLRISEKIVASSNQVNNVTHLVWRWVVAGVGIAGVLLLFWYMGASPDSGNKPVEYLTYQDIEVSGSFYDIDEHLILESYFSSGNSESSAVNTEISAMKDYLIDQNTDIELIINEL